MSAITDAARWTALPNGSDGLPDAWSAVGCNVPRELIEAMDAAIDAARASPPSPSPVPTPSTLS